MIDIKKLRDNPEFVKQALKKRGYDLDVSTFSKLDSSRKSLQVIVELFFPIRWLGAPLLNYPFDHLGGLHQIH